MFFFAAVAAMAMPHLAKTISVESILGEMGDLERLTSRSDPWYSYRQWTSYDRASDNFKDPFANGDAGQFIRSEERDGHTEKVMADADGPGALVRLWSANPAGTLRFYFDGEQRPRFETDMAQLLTGKNPLFPEPFSYLASRGANLYFPMPYAKHLKVTWEGPSDVNIYYAVGTRKYQPDTDVQTFDPSQVEPARQAMAVVAAKLFPPAPKPIWRGGTILPKGVLQANIQSDDGSEIENFQVQFGNKDDVKLPWSAPSRTHNLLRLLRLRMAFDGETTVDVPLGDFFGSAVGVTPFTSLPLTVNKDGTMLCRWPMPFHKSARIWIENDNALPVKLRISAGKLDRSFDASTYTFHTRWHSQTKPTRPMYVFTYADLKGEGRFVGASLQVSNPVAEWWGEGDERVFMEGESFPSMWGTGTEDYFGYAWSNPEPFSRPYHNQPPTPNLGNLGQTENARYHIVDDIPYQQSLRFDMEAWHWANVNCTYTTTAYWYAAPGTTLPEPPDPETLLIPEAPYPKPIVGAIEGENLKWKVTGGTAQVQGGFVQLSGLKQFWWVRAPVGSTATTQIPVPSPGKYELIGCFGHASDYGKFSVSVGSGPATELDLYQSDLEWKRTSLGVFDLPAGRLTIQFQVLQSNPQSDPGADMLGVDYFLLVKK